MSLIEGSISKRDTERAPGISFRTGEEGNVVISEIKSDGLFASTDLSAGMVVLSINGASCIGSTVEEAGRIIDEADDIVAISAQDPSIIIAASVVAESEVLPITTPLFTANASIARIPLSSSLNGNDDDDSSSLLNDRVKITTNEPPVAMPAVQSSLSSNPPRGVEDGGVWGENRYAGNNTNFAAFIGCLLVGFFGLCICFCPQDSRDAYLVNGKVYDASGAFIGRQQNVIFVPARSRHFEIV
jgi:hypothetical protein